MQVIYAFRRSAFYPHHTTGLDLPPPDVRRQYLKTVKSLGFEGLELGVGSLDPAAVRDLRAELEDHGLPCVAVRGGGGLRHPRTAALTRQRLEEAVRFAALIGARIVNTTVSTPVDPNAPGATYGQPVSQGSSRLAHMTDFEYTARGLAQIADLAADHGLQISIEVHQHSIADNSWSALYLLDLINRPNVGLNPDLGNIYWAYDTPEESLEAAILALAPKAVYWHCKNLQRVHIPELQRAIFLQVPLPDGEIDYRFAITAMWQAGYQGPLAVEGMRYGDQLTGDGRSVSYVKSLLAELATLAG